MFFSSKEMFYLCLKIVSNYRIDLLIRYVFSSSLMYHIRIERFSLLNWRLHCFYARFLDAPLWFRSLLTIDKNYVIRLSRPSKSISDPRRYLSLSFSLSTDFLYRASGSCTGKYTRDGNCKIHPRNINAVISSRSVNDALSYLSTWC